MNKQNGISKDYPGNYEVRVEQYKLSWELKQKPNRDTMALKP